MKKLYVILIFGLLLRLLLNTVEYSPDAYSFIVWSRYLTTHSLTDLYDYLPHGYLPYFPGYYYILMGLGYVGNLLQIWESEWLAHLWVKVPVILSDVFLTLLIYKFSETHISRKSALPSAAFYFLHPAVIYTTSVWGQIDTLVTLAGFSGIFFWLKKKYLLSLLILTAGCLVKLQTWSLLPLFLILGIVQLPVSRLLKYCAVLVAFGVMLFLPTIFQKGILWNIHYFSQFPHQYPYTSIYAYNLWATFGFIVSDKQKVFGLLEYRQLGIILLVLISVYIVWPFLKNKHNLPEQLMFAAFLLFFAFAFFPTRIHSRYLIYTLGFFAPFITKFPKLGIGLSLLMIANLLLPNKSQSLTFLVNFLNQPVVILLFVFFGLVLFIVSYKKYLTLIS